MPTTEFCPNGGWGPWAEGDFTPCFTNIIVFGVVFVTMVIAAVVRWWQLRGAAPVGSMDAQPEEKQTLHSVQHVLAAILALEAIAVIIVQAVRYHDGFSNQVVFLSACAVSWLLAGVTLYRDYEYLRTPSIPLRIWWVLAFIAAGLRFRTDVNSLKKGHFDYRMGIYFFSICAHLFFAVCAMVQTLPDAARDAIFLPLLPKKGYADEDGTIPDPLEQRAGLLSKLSFWWLNSTLSLGRKRALELSDVCDLSEHDRPEYQYALLERIWKKQEGTEKGPYVFRTLRRTYGHYFFVTGMLKVVNDITIFTGPVFLNLLVKFVQDPDQPMWHGYAYAAAMLLGAFIQSVAMNQYWFRGFRMGIRVRGAMQSKVYRKALSMSTTERSQFTQGKIVNMMSVDSQRLADDVPYLHLVWSAPLQIIIATILLYGVVSWAVFVGIGFMVLLMPVNAWVAKKQLSFNKAIMGFKDKRVNVTSELLSGVRVVKYFAWEDSFLARIAGVRKDELAKIRSNAYFGAFSSCLWGSTATLTALVTFSAYSLAGKELEASRVFTALALFNVLRFPLNALPMTFNRLVNASVAVNRLNGFLRCQDMEDSRNSLSAAEANNAAIAIKNGDFSWEPETGNLTLSDVNLEVQKGSLTGVIGSVGAGKTSLISAILGEIPRSQGGVRLEGSVSYVPQQAWIQNATVRDNITFGLPFNQEKYDRVVDACALRSDFEQLPSGDRTEIGERGINLSGGQKQRVSIARACYSDADVVILDDPLSAVDVHVGRHIFDKCIRGYLRGRTVLLVMHQLYFLPSTDQVIVLKNGRIEHAGTYTQLQQDGISILKSLEDDLAKNTSTEEEVEVTESTRKTSVSAGPATPKKAAPIVASAKKPEAKPDKLMRKESRETGIVRLAVWKYYAGAFGAPFFIFVMCIYILGQGCSVGSNFWLSHWTEDVRAGEDVRPLKFYLGIYAGLSLGVAFMVLMRALGMAVGSVRVSTFIHSRALSAVLHAPVSYFDTTPLGRIINRFSADMTAVDSSLRQVVGGAMGQVVNLIGILAVISVVSPYFAIGLLPMGVLYYYIQRYYRSSSREVKRLDSIARSPIFANFGESLAGVSTIRAYRAENSFIEKSNTLIHTNLRTSFIAAALNRWLGIRLELIGSLVTFAAALFAVFEHGNKNINPGLVGLSLSYALETTGALNWLIRAFTMAEIAMVSVERLRQYTSDEFDQEPPAVVPHNRPPSDWPSKGEINFQNTIMRYRHGLPAVLKGINLTIKPAEKVGVVGRTGAGKSSLMVALFRLTEIESGGRIIIDGVDIAKIGLKDLRSRMSIIPQDPVLFSGTIRGNLDPFHEYSDSDVWHALEQVHMKEPISQLPKGLEAPVTENGENFSVGQRQLLCMGRALLRMTRILVLDEATAAVDMETDKLIQETVRTAFADRTVLTIAHRLNTVMDSDKVLVLDDGRVAEFDRPQVLMRQDSRFARMVASTD